MPLGPNEFLPPGWGARTGPAVSEEDQELIQQQLVVRHLRYTNH